MKGVLCLNGVLCLQKLITSQLQALRRGAAQLSLPTGLPRNGPAVHQPLTPNDTAIRRQGITDLTCRDSSQWLTANPAFIFNKMSDAAVKTCYHLRHMFPVLGSRKFCICGTPTDCLEDHALVCPQITVRNQTRNTAHSSSTTICSFRLLYRPRGAPMSLVFPCTKNGSSPNRILRSTMLSIMCSKCNINEGNSTRVGQGC